MAACGTPTPDAKTVFDTQVAGAIPTARLITVFDGNTDPNKLLGRPGSYTSAVSFYDTRVTTPQISTDSDGKIEVLLDQASAQKRVDYLKVVTQASPLFTEYTFVTERLCFAWLTY